MPNALCCNRVRLLLGLTCWNVTSVRVPPVAPTAPPLAVAGRLAGVAPLCLFCCAQTPCFAPSAICWGVGLHATGLLLGANE